MCCTHCFDTIWIGELRALRDRNFPGFSGFGLVRNARLGTGGYRLVDKREYRVLHMSKCVCVLFRGEQLSDVLIASVRGMRPSENIVIFAKRAYCEFSVLIDAESRCLGASYARFSFCVFFFDFNSETSENSRGVVAEYSARRNVIMGRVLSEWLFFSGICWEFRSRMSLSIFRGNLWLLYKMHGFIALVYLLALSVVFWPKIVAHLCFG